MYYLEKSNMLIKIGKIAKMSLHPQPIPPVPEDTARVARAAFPNRLVKSQSFRRLV